MDFSVDWEKDCSMLMTISVFDYLSAHSWSNLVLDEILGMLGCLRDHKVHVYWLSLGKI
jgi:hypothetical protein